MNNALIVFRRTRVLREAGGKPIVSVKQQALNGNRSFQHQVRSTDLAQHGNRLEFRKVGYMLELPFIVMGLGMLFYLEEWTSEKPSFMRAAVFVGAVIESTVCLAFRA
jgi:hypothetical protein